MTPANSAARELIYDVGAENGDDSAYYLRLGYKVVGVEANPLAAAALERRFAAELADGRYALVPMGIAAEPGEAPFWICDDEPGRSSFDPSMASSFGARHHCVTVQTCTFRSLLEQYGPAAYVKIDIEGSDDLCLADIDAATRPRFISAEVTCGARQIGRLRDLGYARFKIIAQSTFQQPNRMFELIKRRAGPLARRLLCAAERRAMRRRSETNWRKSFGPSGPFGEETRGRWLDDRQALELIEILDVRPDDHEWYDIHAAL